MNFKQDFRKVFKFLQVKATTRLGYGENGYVVLSGKKFSVGKMSYDEWYLEPYRKNRTERDSFDENTLWEKYDTAKIIQLFIDNGLMECKAK